MKNALIKISMTLFAFLPFILGLTMSIIFKDIKWCLMFGLFLFTNAIHITVLDHYGID